MQRQQQSRPNGPASEQPVSTKLSLYEDPPETRVSIEEFESYAIDRLKGDCMRCSQSSPVTRVAF